MKLRYGFNSLTTGKQNNERFRQSPSCSYDIFSKNSNLKFGVEYTKEQLARIRKLSDEKKQSLRLNVSFTEDLLGRKISSQEADEYIVAEER